MKKHIFGRHFKRDTNERKALFKGLMNELVMHEHITTTEEKAKAIRGKVEKLVTKAKNRKEESRRFLQPYFTSVALEKVLHDVAPRFADRPGGYTRIIKIGRRFSDNASMAIIEWVEKAVPVEIIKPSITAKEDKKSAAETKEATIITAPIKKNAKKPIEKKTNEKKKEIKKK